MSNWGALPSKGGKAGHQGGDNQSTNNGFSGPTFDSMYLQKRSLDPESKTKREKLDEQTPPASTLGKMWQKYMSGPGGPNVVGKNWE